MPVGVLCAFQTWSVGVCGEVGSDLESQVEGGALPVLGMAPGLVLDLEGTWYNRLLVGLQAGSLKLGGGGVIPDLVLDPAPTPVVDGACALARTVTGIGNKLQVELVLQHYGLGVEPAKDLGLDARKVEEVSEKPLKAKTARPSLGGVASESMDCR